MADRKPQEGTRSLVGCEGAYRTSEGPSHRPCHINGRPDDGFSIAGHRGTRSSAGAKSAAKSSMGRPKRRASPCNGRSRVSCSDRLSLTAGAGLRSWPTGRREPATSRYTLCGSNSSTARCSWGSSMGPFAPGHQAAAGEPALRPHGNEISPSVPEARAATGRRHEVARGEHNCWHRGATRPEEVHARLEPSGEASN